MERLRKSSYKALLTLQKVTKVGIYFNSLDLAFDKAQDLLLYAFVVGFDSLAKTIGAIFVKELRDDGDGLVSLGLGRDLGDIDDDLRVEDLLLDTLIEVVRYGPDEHPLRKVTNLAGWYQAIELCGDGG